MRRVGAALVVAAAAAAVAPIPPWWIERWYSRGFYARVQPFVTAASNQLPIALADLALAALIVVSLAGLIAAVRRAGWRRAVRAAALVTLVAAAAIYLWFLLAWGMNYRREPLEAKLAYDPSQVTRDRALAFARTAIAQVNALREQATASAAATDDEALEYSLAAVQHRLGAGGQVHVGRPKRSLLQWYFRKASIDGLTDPFFLEIVLNPDLLPFERPFVIAHEWAHLAGHSDEAEANYIAWLACLNGPPMARYSGWLAAYQHVASGLPRADRRALADLLDRGVVSDLAAERARVATASPAVTAAARGAYDTYLRANRVDEGIASYNAVVRLMLGTAYDEGWTPRLRP